MYLISLVKSSENLGSQMQAGFKISGLCVWLSHFPLPAGPVHGTSQTLFTPRDCLFLRVNIYLFYQRNYTNAVNTKCYVILKLANFYHNSHCSHCWGLHEWYQSRNFVQPFLGLRIWRILVNQAVNAFQIHQCLWFSSKSLWTLKSK